MVACLRIYLYIYSKNSHLYRAFKVHGDVNYIIHQNIIYVWIFGIRQIRSAHIIPTNILYSM